jgi:hypothetical protein
MSDQNQPFITEIDANTRSYVDTSGDTVIMKRNPRVTTDELHAWRVVERQKPAPDEWQALVNTAQASADKRATQIAELFENGKAIYAPEKHAEKFDRLVAATMADLDEQIEQVAQTMAGYSAELAALESYDPIMQGLSQPDQARANTLRGFIKEDCSDLDTAALYGKVTAALAANDKAATTLYHRYLSAEQIAELQAIAITDKKTDVVAALNQAVNPNAGRIADLKSKKIKAELAIAGIRRIKFESDPGPNGAAHWRKRTRAGL